MNRRFVLVVVTPNLFHRRMTWKREGGAGLEIWTEDGREKAVMGSLSLSLFLLPNRFRSFYIAVSIGPTVSQREREEREAYSVLVLGSLHL